MVLGFSLMFQNACAYSPYTTRELDELEKEFVQQINQSNSVIRNPLATQYINHIGRLLAKHSHQSVPDFFIVKSKEINAFAGPGGHIGINTQLILASDNVHELAAVMAHEMAHVRLHHLYRMIQHEKQMRIPLLASILASAALGILNPTLGSGALMASLSGMAQDNINYIRANEKEADRIGIGMLIKADFDPTGMAGFFKKMQQNTRYYYTEHIPAILRTHPLDQDRIAEAENRSAQIRQKTYSDPIDYYLFKELIRNLATDDAKPLLDFYHTQCKQTTHKTPCEYGLALALTKNNQFSEAKKLLMTLSLSPESLYLQAAIAQAEIGQRQFDQALKRLNELYENYPDNYAALVLYARGLMDAGNAEKAASILLKGSREYKEDLTICHMLSQAQANAGQKDYAYFSLAQCELLQGRKRSAMQQLKTAKKLVKNDSFLKARISAKMDEIKFLANN